MIKIIDTILDLTKAGYRPMDASKIKHCAAIGRLILCVSNDIDTRINHCLRAQINSDEEAVTRIVIGAVRVGDAISALTQIAAVRELDAVAQTQIAAVFKEIGTLRGVRDIVAHRACLVKDDSLAFHNALTARTDEKIEVEYFTIDELAEFSDYAQHLGYRVEALSCILTPVPMHPYKKIALNMAVFNALQSLLEILIKTGKVTRAQHERLWTLDRDACSAIHAFVQSLPELDPKHMELERDAIKLMTEFAHELVMFDRPSSREIPARLQKQGRKNQGTAPQ